ncbi:MAG: SgcJ/EcaC family oxidoreductase [Acidobacteria bacterium]|nr:SgcJ/EcaC family oxidoreductase [Acidobacteriota bacterium]MBV9186812.1 SgcJ/EcaC family oxidoreductase [Acidobacteriota bacterium]
MNDIRDLYGRMIAGWNAGDAAAMTRDFADDGQIVGFDGSEVSGREQIASHLAGIFANHKVASYVTLVRDVRELAPDVMLLRAHAGMVPPGTSEINRATNAVQTLIAIKRGDRWRIALFQNTPAAWHGREDDANALTAELQAAFRK